MQHLKYKKSGQSLTANKKNVLVLIKGDKVRPQGRKWGQYKNGKGPRTLQSDKCEGKNARERRL